MNPLTQVKNLQKISARETAAGISDGGSWHADYKDSAYVFIGGLAYELSEGDILAVFAQYGEVVDVNLIRDRGTGKSKGYAFLAYEDQRSTVLAVDNLNGAQVLGRTVRVDHVRKYRKKEEEDEEERQKKREEKGVCYEFQRGSCARGDSCRFSHDLERNKNTGWGAKDETKWKHDRIAEDFRKPSDRDAASNRKIDDRNDERGNRKRDRDDERPRSNDKRDSNAIRRNSDERDRDHRRGMSRREDERNDGYGDGGRR